MALEIRDRVKETCTGTSGDMTLTGAVSGFVGFDLDATLDGDTIYYALEDADGTKWEVGLGTLSADSTTLARTTILATQISFTDTTRQTFSGGTHTIFATYPASKAVYLDASGNLSHTVDISSDTNLVGGTGITLTGDTLSTTDSEIVHDNLSGFVANEHIDWTTDQGSTNIHAGNYTDTNTTYAKADFDLDHLFTLVGASADTDEDLGTFTGSTISDSRTIKQALQDLETELETKTTNTGDITGVDLTGGTGISIDSQTNTGSGAYSSTITCNLEGTELVSTGETGTAKFLRVDGDGTCSWQVPPDTDTTYTKASFDVDHLFTLVGASADTDENLGTFTGSTIADNQTIKAAIQAVETAVETKGATAGSSSIVTVGTIATGAWEATDVAVLHGGTGASNASDARTNLGLVIGTNVQAYDAQLATLAGLTADQVAGLEDLAALEAPASDGQFIVATGAGAFAYESGATVRTSLGLGSIATLSSIDISANTNLAAGTNISLSGDTLNVDDAFLKNDADDTTSGKITAAGYAISAVVTESGTSRTLADSDNGKVIVCTNGSATTITVPASLATGFAVTVIQTGAGQITFSASSTTINNRQSHTKTAGQHARVGLVQTSSDTYNLGGDTAS